MDWNEFRKLVLIDEEGGEIEGTRVGKPEPGEYRKSGARHTNVPTKVGRKVRVQQDYDDNSEESWIEFGKKVRKAYRKLFPRQALQEDRRWGRAPNPLATPPQVIP